MISHSSSFTTLIIHSNYDAALLRNVLRRSNRRIIVLQQQTITIFFDLHGRVPMGYKT